jgi:hypothetical protein
VAAAHKVGREGEGGIRRTKRMWDMVPLIDYGYGLPYIL